MFNETYKEVLKEVIFTVIPLFFAVLVAPSNPQMRVLRLKIIRRTYQSNN